MATVTDLRGKHFLKLADFTTQEITYLLDLAAELKAEKKEGREEQRLAGKEIALIFEKDSTRTRCAFEVAVPLVGVARFYVLDLGAGFDKVTLSTTQLQAANWRFEVGF